MKDWNSNATAKAECWDKTGGKCWYCGDEVHPFRTLSIDHMIPRKRGGSDDIENLVLCCISCNRRKSNKTIDEYRHHLENPIPSFSMVQQEYLTAHGFEFPETKRHVTFYGETL